jgi:hypothetical protein
MTQRWQACIGTARRSCQERVHSATSGRPSCGMAHAAHAAMLRNVFVLIAVVQWRCGCGRGAACCGGSTHTVVVSTVLSCEKRGDAISCKVIIAQSSTQCTCSCDFAKSTSRAASAGYLHKPRLEKSFDVKCILL